MTQNIIIEGDKVIHNTGKGIYKYNASEFTDKQLLSIKMQMWCPGCKKLPKNGKMGGNVCELSRKIAILQQN